MSVGEFAQVLTALAAVGAMLSSWRNARKIDEVHKSTDGKMDKLLEVTSAAEKAKGVIEGKATERANPT